MKTIQFDDFSHLKQTAFRQIVLNALIKGSIYTEMEIDIRQDKKETFTFIACNFTLC